MFRAPEDGAPRLMRLLCAVTFLLIVSAVPVGAQVASGNAASIAPPAVTRPADAEAGRVDLLVGRSTVLNVGVPIVRVSLTRPEIADAVATSTQQLLIHGKAAGAITMFVWDRAGGIKRYEVVVRRDLGEIGTQMQQLFPGEPITVSGNGHDLVLSGTVSSKYVIEKAADVAAGYVEKKENIVNLLQQQQGAQSNQVLLRVRFAEVSRTALTELGASFFTGGAGYKDYVARTTTEQFPAPFFDSQSGENKLVFSDYLNLFLFNNKEGLGTLIHAMQNKGLFQSLAEPNLVAENGKEASFLAGGEYPYPAVQGTGATLAVTIVFKEFGIRLNFLPTIVGTDTVHLKVRPEVSSLDFTNAVSYQGFRIPSLSTRRAETEVELQNGQTFAIAGLLNNSMTSTMQKIPGIGDIPILGLLFRSKAAQKAQTELVVMITPEILPRNSTGASKAIPNPIEPYLGPPGKTVPNPAPYIGSPRQDDPPAASAQAASSQATPGGAATPATVPAVTPPADPAPRPVPAPRSPGAGAGGAVPPAAAATASQTATPPPVAVVSAPAAASPPPDPKVLEREHKAQEQREKAEAKALKERQEAEARAEKKRQEEEARRLQAEASQAEKEAKAAAKRAAEQARAERAAAERARKQEEKLAKEQAKLEAEAAKKQAEVQQKQAKEMREAEARLQAAQEAYEAALKKAKEKQVRKQDEKQQPGR